MLADIANGNADFADVMFLVAFILGVVAAMTNYSATTARHTIALLSLAVATAALGFLVL